MSIVDTLNLPGKIVSGLGSLAGLGELAAQVSRGPVLLVADPAMEKLGVLHRARTLLAQRGLSLCGEVLVPGEPTFAQVEALLGELDAAGMIVAIGGGSAIDTAKILSVAATNPALREELADASRIQSPGLPFIAVPTTAGTGAEATPNAILLDTRSNSKIGVVSARMIPGVVILDGELTASLPLYVAAATGFDALAHALESYLSKKANGFTDFFALQAMELIFQNIVDACIGDHPQARQQMLKAAFYAGVCLTTSTTHVVHAMAYPLAGRYHVPHGPGISVLLEPVIRRLAPACWERLSHAARRTLGAQGSDEQAADCLLDTIGRLARELTIPKNLSAYGVEAQAAGEMAQEAIAIRRLFDNSPMELTQEDLVPLYRQIAL